MKYISTPEAIVYKIPGFHTISMEILQYIISAPYGDTWSMAQSRSDTHEVTHLEVHQCWSHCPFPAGEDVIISVNCVNS